MGAGIWGGGLLPRLLDQSQGSLAGHLCFSRGLRGHAFSGRGTTVARVYLAPAAPRMDLRARDPDLSGIRGAFSKLCGQYALSVAGAQTEIQEHGEMAAPASLAGN